MDKPPTTEELAFRAIRAMKEAAKRANPYNDFGGVMGIQDELGEIFEDLEADLRKACRRYRRLVSRIDKLEAGELTVERLQANAANFEASHGLSHAPLRAVRIQIAPARRHDLAWHDLLEPE